MACHTVYFRSFSADVARILFCMRNVQSWYTNHQLKHQFIICITDFEHVFLHLVFLLGIGQFTSECSWLALITDDLDHPCRDPYFDWS